MAYLEVFAAAIAWVVLPGLAAAALLDRGTPAERVTPERFVTFALASGLAIWVVGARVLDRVDGLTRGPAIVVAVLLAVASVGLMIGPGRSTLRALMTRGTAVFAGWAFGSTFLGAAPLLRLLYDQRDALINSTPWYYWNLVRQTVAAGGTPSRSYEWGTWVKFLDAYPGFTPGVTVFALAGGTKTLAAAHVVTAIAMLSAGLAIFLLVRALGGSLAGGAFATLLFFAIDVFASKLSSLRPESLGYAFALLVPILALEFVRTGHKRVLVVLAATFVGLGQVHGIDWLFGCGMLAGAVMAGFPARVEWRRWVARGSVVVMVALGAWAVANLMLSGHLSGASDLGGLPSIKGGVDPTWQFASLAQGNPGSTPPTVAHLLSTSLQRGFRGLGWPWFAAISGIALVVLIVRAALGPASPQRSVSRRALTFLLVSAAIAFAVSAFFSLGWTTYVPRRTGFTRLLQVAVLLVPLGAGVALSVIPWGAPEIRRRITVAAVAVALVFAGFATIHGQSALAERGEQRPLPDTLGALRDLKLSSDDVVLTNVYSEGIIPVMTGAKGVLDGRAPYADAKLLARANRLLTGTRAFLAAPKTGAPLPCSGISYVLVATDGRWSLGTPFVLPTDLAGLELRTDLKLVSSAPGFRLYRVRDRARKPTGHELDCSPRHALSGI